MVEGDIVLYDEEEYQDEYYSDAVEKTSRLWPKINGEVIIPYTLPNGVPEDDKAQIKRAIVEFHLKTCIRQFF